MKRRVIVSAAAAAALLGAYAVVVEPRWPVVRERSVPVAGLNAPATLLLYSDVDYPHAGRCREVVRRTAADVRPDAVLIAGDFFDRVSEIADAGTLRAGAADVAAVPAPLHVLVPGEEESRGIVAVRGALGAAGIRVAANEPFAIATPGGPIDAFGADILRDPAPWGIATIDGRPAAVADGRPVDSAIVYAPPGGGSFVDVTLTLAFFLDRRDSFVDLRFGWLPEDVVFGGTGWRIVRHQYHRTFRLHAKFTGNHRLGGRTESGYDPEPGIWHRARIVFEDDGARTRVRARFWPERGVEPSVWTIDAVDSGPGRRRSGTIAFGASAGLRAIADLAVRDRFGRALLVEPFDDPARLHALWRQPSKLAAWTLAPTRRPRLVLSHNPDVVYDLARIGPPYPDLVLAGHTHGGQVRLPFLPPFYTSTRLPRRYASGFHAWRGIPLYVTPGIGTSILPVRFLDRPEVTVIRLVPRTTPASR